MSTKFKVTIEQKDGVTMIRLAGILNEQVDLEKEIGKLPPRVNVVCRDITQINSLGVKAWIDFFLNATRNGVDLSFTECPPPVVEQLNYINNFSAGAKVVSVSVPFTCEACHKELRGIIKTEDLRKVSYRLPPIRCIKCGGKAIFDDVPEEYFSFLIKRA